MCGIAGYVGTVELDPARVERTLRLMHRRGPDHSAHRHFKSVSNRHVHLLHARLRILDLEARSNQPFRRGDRTIVFNGEVYNFVELKRDLEARGHSFVTTSDTEVLLAALSQDGEAALDRCEGMWAFAIHDENAGSLLLARDRFGEKPLYLHEDATGLYFASEVKFLAALAGRRFEIDRDQLLRYLVNGYKSVYKSGATFFRGVAELAAGTLMHVDRTGTTTRRRYWDFSYAPDETMTRERAAEEVRARLIESVRLRLRSDVPIAFCMSGGIDSNSIIAVAKKVLGYEVHGFTIDNDDPRYEEREMIALAVKELGIRHTVISPHVDDPLTMLRTLVRQHDAPVYTISYFVHWQLMRSVAAHGYRVSVSGTGADELFTGYYDHHLHYLGDTHGTPAADAHRRGWSEHVKPFIRNPFLSDPDLMVRDRSFRDHIFLDAQGFAQFLTVPFAEAFAEHDFTKASLLRNRMLNELFYEAVPVILHEDDLNAMYFSIENRSPYLDRALFELSLRIPTPLLMRDGMAKVVLRDAMRWIVPDPILDNRRKVGFNAPLGDVVDIHDPTVRASLLDDSPIFELVRKDRIEKLLDESFLPNSRSKFLFYFLCSKIFLEELGAS